MAPEILGQDYPLMEAVPTDALGLEEVEEVKPEYEYEEGLEMVEVKAEEDGKIQFEEKDAQVEVEVEVPASQPRGDEVEEEVPENPPHHMLDEYCEKVLTRAQQDQALGVAGKGRKKKEKTGEKQETKKSKKGGEAKKRGRKPKASAEGQTGQTAPKKRRTKDPVARLPFSWRSFRISIYQRQFQLEKKTSPKAKAKASTKAKAKASPKAKPLPKRRRKLLPRGVSRTRRVGVGRRKTRRLRRTRGLRELRYLKTKTKGSLFHLQQCGALLVKGCSSFEKFLEVANQVLPRQGWGKSIMHSR